MKKKFFTFLGLFFFALSAASALDTQSIKETLNEALLKLSEQNYYIQVLKADLLKAKESLENSDQNLQEAEKKIKLLETQLIEAQAEVQKLKDSILRLENLLKQQLNSWILPSVISLGAGIGIGILIDKLFFSQ